MKFTIQELAEAAILVALGIVAGFIKIPVPPVGNVSLAFIPLIIIALRNSPIKTFIYTGAVYGLIDCLMDGWGLSTFPLEYLLAVGSLCIISFFRKQLFEGEENAIKEFAILIAAILGWTLIRFFLCSLDGFLQGWAPSMGASMSINAPNVFVDTAFALIIILLIYMSLRPLNVKKYNENKKDK